MDQISEIKREDVLHHIPPYMTDDEDPESQDEEDSKRPRLRLARACDRCKRRKIKCDTNLPCCLPCISAKQQCTFNTPTRRTSKPRPHEKPRKNVKDLEARMASLEQQLRQVPPHVHNAALTQLDASLSTTNALASSSFNPPKEAALAEIINPFAKRPEINRSQTTMSSSTSGLDSLTKEMEGISLSPGFIYLDEMGMTKWQGATSGFPLLELLAEAERHPPHQRSSSPAGGDATPGSRAGAAAESSPFEAAHTSSTPSTTERGRATTRTLSPEAADGRRCSTTSKGKSRETVASESDFFPGRKPRVAQKLNPEASWKVITGVIPPDLMDVLIRSYLSTTHLLWPFLHVPSFLADYANPSRWGEPGFARFIVAVCTLSSRHVDDPRVRADPTDPSSAGISYLELFKKMQDLPNADRPTLYSMQASFLAAIYCMGLGTLSKAFMLFAESITMAIDGGLHRDVGGYDIFNPIEREVRKRTFWSIYCWDKASGACFGRPAMVHLRDCDVSEPLVLDDEYIMADGLGVQPEGSQSRICAFVAAIRLHVVLEGVLDGSIRPSDFSNSLFLSRAAVTIAKRHPQSEALREEEELLAEWDRLLEPHWKYNSETIASKDPIRITQAERLDCLENLVKMLIYRHRFSGFVLSPAQTPEESTRHVELCRQAMSCALAIVANHLHISQRGFMTYYGVHVIHQLAQAGRTLVAVILNCKSAESRPLIASSIEGFRSCVGLLRRFSGRYVCGLRSADILEEFCRICRIPVDTPQVPNAGKPSPAWLRPVRKRHSPSPNRSSSYQPESSFSPPANIGTPSTMPVSVAMGGTGDAPMENASPASTTLTPLEAAAAEFAATQASFGDLNQSEDDISLKNDNNRRSSSASAPYPAHTTGGPSSTLFDESDYFDLAAAASNPSPLSGGKEDASVSPTGRSGSEPRLTGGLLGASGGVGGGFKSFGEAVSSIVGGGGVGVGGGAHSPMPFSDFGLPSAGMDGLMPDVQGNDNMSASEIFQLLNSGEFDYGTLFPDQEMFSLADESLTHGNGGSNGHQGSPLEELTY